MSIRDEIIERIDKLPAAEQARVLRFVTDLGSSLLRGQSGASFLEFFGTLDDQSAREMKEAIEEDCERIDVSEW